MIWNDSKRKLWLLVTIEQENKKKSPFGP